MARKDWKVLAAMVAVFAVAYFLPLSSPKVRVAIVEAFKLLQWYARNHTLACVVPALFIAGGIITFLSKASVMRYLGPTASKPLAYAVASVSGAVACQWALACQLGAPVWRWVALAWRSAAPVWRWVAPV